MKRLAASAIILAILFPGCGEPVEQRASVLLIIIDTLRADHLGCYGYHRNTSPTIDSLAAAGTLFLRCQAQAPWTLPAIATLYTGLTERSHRCSHYGGFSHGLDPEMPTLATILQEHGYSTAAFVNVGYLGPMFGMEKGYDFFWMKEDAGSNANSTVHAALTRLGSLDGARPFLLTVHLFDPHLPYDPPYPYDTAFSPTGTGGITEWPRNLEDCRDPELIQHMIDLYDSEILWTDGNLGHLFSEMRAMGLLENTLVVLVADHGEEFMEHGDWGHARNLYQPALHIPLIISGPGIPAGVSEPLPVGQFDVLPTILHYLGIPVPGHVEGISLLGTIPADRMLPSSGVIAQVSAASGLKEGMKVLWYVQPDSVETYDLEADPGETTILPTDSLLFDQVLSYWAWPPVCNPTTFESETVERRRLEGLGYIR